MSRAIRSPASDRFENGPGISLLAGNFLVNNAPAGVVLSWKRAEISFV